MYRRGRGGNLLREEGISGGFKIKEMKEAGKTIALLVPC
jgi:hypothetical protein